MPLSIACDFRPRWTPDPENDCLMSRLSRVPIAYANDFMDFVDNPEIFSENSSLPDCSKTGHCAWMV